jgi:hypothetical protein
MTGTAQHRVEQRGTVSTGQTKSQWLLAAIIMIAFVVLVSTYFPDDRGDWIVYYKPAIIEMFSGSSPYTVAGYHNAPWTLIILAPLALLPDKIAAAVTSMLHPIIISLIVFRFGAKPLQALMIAFSGPSVLAMIKINYEWVPLLGLVLPPWLGLFFITTKPQTAGMLAIYWLFDSWQRGGIYDVIKTFSPISVITLLSFVVYGPWLFESGDLLSKHYNTSIFPWGIPVGLVVLVYSIIRKNKEVSVAASPLLSPYVNSHSWIAVLIGAINKPRILPFVFVVSWVLIIIFFR